MSDNAAHSSQQNSQFADWQEQRRCHSISPSTSTNTVNRLRIVGTHEVRVPASSCPYLLNSHQPQVLVNSSATQSIDCGDASSQPSISLHRDACHAEDRPVTPASGSLLGPDDMPDIVTIILPLFRRQCRNPAARSHPALSVASRLHPPLPTLALQRSLPRCSMLLIFGASSKTRCESQVLRGDITLPFFLRAC